MRKFSALGITLLALVATLACTEEGVGDPCEPESCPPSATGEGCDWQAEEVYLEHFSLQCRTRVCMVFKVDEMAGIDPYCTRRCGPGSAWGGCPGKYACTEVVAGESDYAGCYCVEKAQLELGQFGADQPKVDACK